MDISTRIFYKDRREKLESMVDTGKRETPRRALKNTRRRPEGSALGVHTSSMLRMFFSAGSEDSDEVDTMLACFAAGCL